MPRRIQIPFVGQTAKDRSVAVNNQETVNFMQAIKGAGAKAPVVLESSPGLVDYGPAGDGAIRSPRMLQWQGDLYGVFGDELVQLSVTTGITTIGTLNANGGKVRFAGGRDYLMLVDGTDGYSFDGTTFAQITDVDFPGQSGNPSGLPTHCAYKDGFFIVNDAATDNFYICETIEDPTGWNPLDFEAASVAPDAALAVAATAATLWVFGEETVQPYYNTGNADFPYELVLNGVQETGILAPQSLAESDDGIFFIATTPEGGTFVYQIRGHDGQKISADAQDYQLSQIDDLEDSYGFIYKQAGKSFYVLQLGDGPDETLIFNISAQAWESREMADGSAWRAGGAGMLGMTNIVGSRLAPRAYSLDLSVYTDDTDNLIRRRRTQIFHSNDSELDWWEVVADIEGGVGNLAAPGDDPQIRLRYSDDGGRSWSNYLPASMGKIGEYTRRAVWRNLGQSRKRILELSVSDPVAVTIINGYAVVEELDD